MRRLWRLCQTFVCPDSHNSNHTVLLFKEALHTAVGLVHIEQSVYQKRGKCSISTVQTHLRHVSTEVVSLALERQPKETHGPLFQQQVLSWQKPTFSVTFPLNNQHLLQSAGPDLKLVSNCVISKALEIQCRCIEQCVGVPRH